jgi:hypothetical protein
MPPVPSSTFERWLRGLGDGDAREFVADLYRARGHSVQTREDGALVFGDDESVYWVAGGRFAHRLRRPTPPRDANVLVAVRPTGRLTRLAAGRGLTLVSPAELRNLALYGLSRAECERLFERYFGASPFVPAAPDGTVSDRQQGLRGLVTRPANDSVSTLVVLAVVGTLVLVAVLGPAAPGASLRDSSVGAASVDGEAGAVTGDVTAESPSADEERGRYPPGVAPTGVTSAEKLANAHATALSGRSYRLIIRQSGTEDWTGRVWRGAWQQAEVEDRTTYRYVVTGYQAAQRGEARLVQYSVYGDGRDNYIYTEDGGENSFVRVPITLGEREYGPFETRSAAAIERYLNTTETTVTQVNWTVEPYRIVATGRPLALDNAENVTNYRAQADVGPDGYVSLLTVRYDVLRRNDTRSASFRMEYANLDDVRVRPPPWYEDAQNQTMDGLSGATPTAPTDSGGTSTDAPTDSTDTPTDSTDAPTGSPRAQTATTPEPVARPSVQTDVSPSQAEADPSLSSASTRE